MVNRRGEEFRATSNGAIWWTTDISGEYPHFGTTLRS